MLGRTLLLSFVSSAFAYVGHATFYDDFAQSETACGGWHNAEEHIAAISHVFFDESTSTSPHCGHQAIVKYNDKSVVVGIVDECEGCAENHIDLSPSAFAAIVDGDWKDIGEVTVEWNFI